MQKLLKSKYQLSNPKITKLGGYIHLNYKIESGSETWILKVCPNKKEIVDLAEAENKILDFLNENESFPKPVKNNKYQSLTFQNEKNEVYRLLTYLKGDFFAETKHTPKLFESLGTFLAKMDLQLQKFKNYVIEARQIEWDLKYFRLLNELPTRPAVKL